MKKLKRVLSLTKSPRIEESISEVEEYLKETQIDDIREHEENGIFIHSDGHLNGNNNQIIKGNIALSYGQVFFIIF